jgi:hypothetical protein
VTFVTFDSSLQVFVSPPLNPKMEDHPLLAFLAAIPVFNKDTQFVNTVFYCVADSTGYWWVGIWIYSVQGTDIQCLSYEPVCV